MKKLNGLVAAAYTPMHADESIAPELVGSLVDYAVRHRLAGLFVNGSTGEFASLSTAERKICAEAYLDAARGRMPIIVNVASCSIAELRELAEHAVEHGADALCLMMPFYFKPDSAAAFTAFVRRAAEFCGDLPLFLYHAPGLVTMPFPLTEFLKRAVDEVPSFAGVKYTGSDLFEFRSCLDLAGDLQVLYGRDEMLLPALAVGAQGAIGTTFNYLPRVYQGVIEAFRAGDMERARAGMAISATAVFTARKYGFSSLKLFMKYAGVDVGPMRTPCDRISAASELAFAHELETNGLMEFLG